MRICLCAFQALSSTVRCNYRRTCACVQKWNWPRVFSFKLWQESSGPENLLFIYVKVCVHGTYLISSRSWACLVCWTADGTWVLRPVEQPSHLRPSWESYWPKMWLRKSLNYGKRKERCVYMSTYHLKGNEKIILCGQLFSRSLNH